MTHDDDAVEVQQQFAEAKLVIQQLAGQVDSYSNAQQQLAGLPRCFVLTLPFCDIYAHPSRQRANPALVSITAARLCLAAQRHTSALPNS